MQQPQQAQAIPNTVIPPTTNKRLCISQEDAMSRQVENNSSYVYFDQNKDIMYEVNTDAGKSTNAAVNEPDTASQNKPAGVHKSTVPAKSADSSAN